MVGCLKTWPLLRFGMAAGLGVPLWSCASARVPDPSTAIRAYAEAARKGDSQAIYALLSERSRREYRPADIARMVAEERGELAAQAAGITDPHVVLRASGRVRYADGEEVELDLQDGGFRVASADGIPAQARSPEQALGQLRRALARRSYAGLVRVLSPATRSAIEADLRSLVEGLERPDGLEVHVIGDSAQVRVGQGHMVRLRQEQGVWTVEDFD